MDSIKELVSVMPNIQLVITGAELMAFAKELLKERDLNDCMIKYDDLKKIKQLSLGQVHLEVCGNRMKPENYNGNVYLKINDLIKLSENYE